MKKTTLYNKDAKGNIRVWSIEPDYDCEGLSIEHGQANGEMQTKFESIDEGKQSRDVLEQIDSRIESRINKKLDRGYVRDIKQLANRKFKLNQLGLPLPMLAHRIDKVKEVDYRNSLVQFKYNGHRCLITKQNGKMLAYSRNGKFIDSIPEILAGLSHMNEGDILDGELYIHGVKLNNISSFIKKHQGNSKLLKFVCYDIMLEAEYKDRLEYIQSFQGHNYVVAPTYTNVDESRIPGMLVEVIDDGYEGLILRQPDFGYEAGKRSRGLIKIKQFLDYDFEVVDIIQSKDGWAILECDCEGGIFNVSAPGTIDDKYEVWRNKENYIGKYVNVKYAEMTAYDIPFHPVAEYFLDEI